MKRPLAAACLCAAVMPAGVVAAAPPVSSVPPEQPGACKGTLYLTFDTGSQSQAQYIAETLARHQVRATFFLANEKTVNGDHSLDPSWAGYWKARVAEGHAFGTHTFDHVYVQRDLPGGRLEMKPQFGPDAGRTQVWTSAQYCEELKRVEKRFSELTGGKLDPLWRAPGGRITPGLLAAGKACGYTHVGWTDGPGFSGDELPSDKWPNARLLERSLKGLKDGDIFVAHLGIWSRKDPWAPAVLDPLITGLKQKGFCFATLRERPAYRKTR